MNATTINLESLLDLSARLIDSNDAEHILNAALLSLMGKLRVTKAAALVPQDDGLRATVIKGRVQRNLFKTVNETSLFDCTEAHEDLWEEGMRLCIPVFSKGRLWGLLALGASFGTIELGATERHYASLVGLIAANALQAAEHVTTMIKEKSLVESRNQLLESMFEMSMDLGSMFTRDQILQIFSFRLMGQVMVSRFALILYQPDCKAEVELNRFAVDFAPEQLEALRHIESICSIHELESEQNLRAQLSTIGVEVLVPLMVKNESRGMLIIGRKMIGSFSEFEYRFIEALGSTLATALENARLFEEEVEKKRYESELTVARQIQHKLFPDSLPQVPGAQLAARNISSQQVGGDYFDAIRIADERVLLAIADVSGKGMPASILMANVQAALRILAPLVSDIRDIVIRLNDVLYENTAHDRFVTFFGTHFDATSKCLQYTNAGHNPPMLFRADGSVEELSDGGLILGVMPSMYPYNRGEVQLNSGDVLVLFTDGVNEAMDAEQREYSDERIRQCVLAHRTESAQHILEHLLHDVQLHVGDAAQSDDITVLILKID